MKEIARRQNESTPLKIQFASRMLFNRAETENRIIWVFCTLSALAGFLNGSFATWISPTVIISAELVSFILSKRMEKNILHAANLRSMFDRYVFGMSQSLSEETADVLYELAENLASRNIEEFILQTTHTASDTPPGVKSWYNTNIDIPDHTPPAFFLIKENTWWDKVMVRSKYTVYGVTTIITVILTIVFGRGLPFVDTLVILAGIIGLLLRLVERICVVWQYKKISVKIDGFVENFENFAPGKGLDVLQNAIEERRRLPLVHCNAIHTRLAKALHEKYEAIHNERLN